MIDSFYQRIFASSGWWILNPSMVAPRSKERERRKGREKKEESRKEREREYRREKGSGGWPSMDLTSDDPIQSSR